ncbi:hypothetical protein Godav_015904 [Gossypium davidsonii]|uniref:Uncharacterized protein n=1 Tax=Gossypium davidsonii TaxID=34287 RepID=A0A7J8RPP5_GOSDV|nr:hypothetical protein [Gossypium davidsonii]
MISILMIVTLLIVTLIRSWSF